MASEIFKVEFEDQCIVGDFLGREFSDQVLMLHGAGGAHRGKMLPLREELALKGIGSCAFDFVGHGDTGGDLKKSSLASRTRQACAVIHQLGLCDRGALAVIAASMGGHIAVRLLEHYTVDRLVLVVPAMYHRDAYDVRFDMGFSEIIRRPMSWRDSEGLEILSTYQGRLLLISAELDQVIPREVVEQYYSSATSASVRSIYTAPGVGHMVFTELREKNPEEMHNIVDRMVRVLLD